ncbi:MAG: hypothetical protein JXB32_10235 [Deltaproteobacteria bacterium]|nr:hypothetical protein [Deltaproteobacteria bacterium]
MRRAAVILAALLAAGCDGPPPAVRLTLETDLAMPAELDEIHVLAAASRTEAGQICGPTSRGFRLSATDALPLRLVIERGETYTVWVWARIEGFAGGRRILAREVVHAWPDEGVTEVTVRLERACVDRTCGAADQCIEGSCRPLQMPGLLDDAERIDADRPCSGDTP